MCSLYISATIQAPKRIKQACFSCTKITRTKVPTGTCTRRLKDVTRDRLLIERLFVDKLRILSGNCKT